MWNRYIKNEEGNTLLVILGLLIGAIFISFIFFDFFTTFATKRVSQTGADAAALAAANEIKHVYDDKLKSEIELRMERLREVANEFVEEKTGEIQEEKAEKKNKKDKKDSKKKKKDKKDEQPPELTNAELDKVWKEVLDKMEVPKELRSAVRYEYEEVDANVALKYFFKNVWYKEWFSNEIKEINEVACEAIIDAEPQWQEAAQYYATKNGAEEDIELIFKGDEFKVMAKVKREASFITVGDDAFSEDERSVYAEAEASIKTPKDIEITCW
ncbi:pilus assembly protein TadG-related protein [Lederbergia galactosidilytica]|uniref:Putative Flp pilus-assembly TadG-like N-terminal domain-containing protein n=1 Tax=Lederbergia galactosidilytica TaxID=217031 RepID=A0A0Q9XXE4_9BACI|nr:pilus assembly protein TadG-related protein [Lederbergia galactosidilytica]KRG09374.1 hypothetical protein ACA29_23205 [Lederbergia galactosidilytica]KRG13178.1 hypothetical protein ACA30_16410 [Virgibacillus soli]MBP1917293.1 hypothetical protein [Lederbergia galactosidilytica]OAK69003.1 hypothetical protein ABB05_14565 [Lederbergia galactosidilytica]